MDKRIGYICPGGAYGENLCHCVATDQACPDQASCEYVAFVSPFDLAALETQLTEANAACGLKDGALQDVLSECAVTFDDERLKYVEVQMSRGVLDDVRKALSSTPESVNEEAGYARGGRAAEEWVRVNPYATPRRLEDDSVCGYAGAVEEIKQVIAQAREGEKS